MKCTHIRSADQQTNTHSPWQSYSKDFNPHASSKQHQQQARRSLGSFSNASSNSTVRMESTRPSIYLQNQYSGRTGVNNYTCSPRLSLYLQEMKDGPQLGDQERWVSRSSSVLLKQLDSSRSFIEDLHIRTNQARSVASASKGDPSSHELQVFTIWETKMLLSAPCP